MDGNQGGYKVKKASYKKLLDIVVPVLALLFATLSVVAALA